MEKERALQLTAGDRRVLTVLGSKPKLVLSFAMIAEEAGMDRDEVRSACHRLRKMGFAMYCRGGDLRNSFAPGGRGYNGSGYAITVRGNQALEKPTE